MGFQGHKVASCEHLFYVYTWWVYLRTAFMFIVLHKHRANEAPQGGTCYCSTLHPPLTRVRPPPVSDSWQWRSEASKEVQQCHQPVLLQNSPDTGYNHLTNIIVLNHMQITGLSTRPSCHSQYILPTVDPA